MYAEDRSTQEGRRDVQAMKIAEVIIQKAGIEFDDDQTKTACIKEIADCVKKDVEK
ncbi:MAG: hypothetical protein O3C05_03250 [Proteobacteria bacterium]|nr:hypothetical protein [Pseudomonadota bacterium]